MTIAMTEVQLCKALRERFREVLKDIYHPTDPSRDRAQEFKAPDIENGWLPPKRSSEEHDFPYVIVRPSEGDTEVEQGHVQDVMTVKLIIGSYGEEPDDHEYTLVILRRVMNDLRQKPLVGGVFKCRPEIKWKLSDEQATTVFILEAMIKFEMPTPQDVLEDDGYAI